MVFISLAFVLSLLISTDALKIYSLEILRHTTCEKIYRNQTGYANGTIDFSVSINGLTCPPKTYYHCLTDTRDASEFIQFCSDWIWIVKGKCPSYFSYHTLIQPYDCGVNDTGCPRQQYQSHEYYKYSHCLTMSPTTTENIINSHHTMGESKESKSFPHFIWAIIILLIVIGLIVVVIFVRKRREKRIFLHQRAIDAARRKLSNGRVVIAGMHGTGKRTIIKQLYTGMRGLVYKEVTYPHFELQPNKSYFIVLDEHWLKDNGLDTLESEIEKLDDKSVYVITTSQKYLNKDRTFKDKYKDAIIDLSGDYELNEDEKLKFISFLCETHNVSKNKLSVEERERLANYEPKHYGYIKLCTDLFKKKAFKTPLKFMEENDQASGRKEDAEAEDSLLSDDAIDTDDHSSEDDSSREL